MTRAAWFHSHAPDRDGFYTCYICGDKLLPRETTLDHVKSRSRHPELRFEPSNLQPCCWRCNTAKGSRDLDELELEGGEIWTTNDVKNWLSGVEKAAEPKYRKVFIPTRQKFGNGS